MASAHVACDKKSGRIIGVHHGQVSEEHARQLAANYARLREHAKSKRSKKLGKDQIAVISVDVEAFKEGTPYKVDVKRKKLVETEKGVALSVGALRRS